MIVGGLNTSYSEISDGASTEKISVRVDRISKENYWQSKSNRHIEMTVQLQRTHSFQIHGICKSWSHKASLNQFQRMHTSYRLFYLQTKKWNQNRNYYWGINTLERINKVKSWFFKNINEISIPLATLNKEKEQEGTNNIRNEKIKNYEWFWQQKDSMIINFMLIKF